MEGLTWKEVMARADLEAADELLNVATTKLHDAISYSTVSKQNVSVTIMMLDAATTNRVEVMQWIDTIMDKQPSLDRKTHKLLEKTIPTKQTAA